ncbi:hypothetical protein GCM10022381_31710 [Leifsonia kafniensis]|uniref:DUF4232 domain-containing protein n=1 Tax=Leifsonia kafniensis TaxID=475957 RepID=A0ABP7KT60_9MICO
MSTIKHPVGPRSDKVYRRRRLVVGLGLLAVIIIIVLIIVKPGSSVGEPGNSPTSTKGMSTDAPSSSSKPVAAADGGACDPANITVEALTSAPDYDADQLPELSLSLTNTGSASCVIDAGTAKQVFTITSGDDVWWTSTDCQTGAADASVTLAAGATEKSSAPLTWDRTRSAKDTCESDSRELAPADGASYHLSVTVDGIAAATPTQFLLN